MCTESCKDVPCVNGECLEGSCFCDEWCEGNNCDTLTTTKYLGTYQGPYDLIDYDGSLLTGCSGGGRLIEGDTINTLLIKWRFKHRMVFQTDDDESFTKPDNTVDNFVFWHHGVVTSDSLFVTQY